MKTKSILFLMTLIIVASSCSTALGRMNVDDATSVGLVQRVEAEKTDNINIDQSPPKKDDHEWGGEIRSYDEGGWGVPHRTPPLEGWVYPSWFHWLMVRLVQDGLI